MSGYVTGWVLTNSEVEGAARLVLIVLADHASSDGTNSWPTVETIQHEARLKSRRSVQQSLRQLEEVGAIVSAGQGAKGQTNWTVLMEGGAFNAPQGGASDDMGGRNLRHEGGAFNAPKPSFNRPEEPSNAQSSLLPDPVNETWGVYVAALDRPKAVLTPKVRKWIADAHQAIGVEMTRQAIEGLAASDYHRENGYVGIEYAIVPKRGETIEGRAEKMSARVRANASSPESGSLAELAADIRSKHGKVTAEMLLDDIENVQNWLRNYDHPGLKGVGERATRQLRQSGYELVSESGIVTGYRKVAE